MAYQGYSDQPASQGYGNQYNSNPYGQQGNPYGQENPYAAGQYDRPAMQQQGSSRYDEERQQGGYEMGAMNGNDPNRILNECRNIDREIDSLESQHSEILRLTDAYCKDTSASGPSPYKQQLDAKVSDIMSTYKALVQRIRKIKSDPESGNPRNAPSVGKTDRRIKASMNSFQNVERDSRKMMQDNAARQYRIVRPDASDAEVREAIEDSSNDQVFSQAVMSANRRGEAQSAARNVRDRHEAVQKIERDVKEILDLFQQLDAMVVQQDVAVQRIEEQSENVKTHVDDANVQLDGAVTKARAARKKKFICLGIAVLIVIIIVVVVVVVVEVVKK